MSQSFGQILSPAPEIDEQSLQSAWRQQFEEGHSNNWLVLLEDGVQEQNTPSATTKAVCSTWQMLGEEKHARVVHVSRARDVQDLRAEDLVCVHVNDLARLPESSQKEEFQHILSHVSHVKGVLLVADEVRQLPQVLSELMFELVRFGSSHVNAYVSIVMSSPSDTPSFWMF